MDYTFEQDQFLRFEIYDIDSPSADLSQHDFLGFAECKLAQIVAAGYNRLTLPLLHDKHAAYVALPQERLTRSYKGTVVLVVEELTKLKEEVKTCILRESFTYLNALQRLI